jgi:23S rRNA U2552 (ribose-2'-O)-methylase RlmE/FtsJ
MFRWGIVTRKEFELQMMSYEDTYSSVLSNGETIAPVSRAYYKMSEIIEAYLPKWNWRQDNPDYESVALDMGAAPGGWSQVLSGICSTVLAVDPAELQLRDQYSNVKHLQCVVQAQQVKDALCSLHAPIGFIVCDMNSDCRDCAKILIEHIFPFIRPGRDAVLVLTLKLVKNAKQGFIARAVEGATKILSSSSHVCCSDYKVVHLTANSRSERTLVCKIATVTLT